MIAENEIDNEGYASVPSITKVKPPKANQNPYSFDEYADDKVPTKWAFGRKHPKSNHWKSGYVLNIIHGLGAEV